MLSALEKLFIDFIGKLPRSKAGNCYALVVVDAFSKFSWVFPLREATAALAVSSLRSLFGSCGPCRYLVSDNGSQFTSKLFRNFCFGLGIHHITTTPYYPKPNHSERFNRNLRAALIAYHHSDHSSWDSNLPWLQFAFNTARHESLSVTPFSLFYSFSPNSPLSNLWHIYDLLPDPCENRDIKQIWAKARRNLQRAHDKMAQRYNCGRKLSPFKLGDKVMLLNYPISKAVNRFAAKLAPRYTGPFSVIAVYNGVNLLLKHDRDGYQRRAHVSQVKMFAN